MPLLSLFWPMRLFFESCRWPRKWLGLVLTIRVDICIRQAVSADIPALQALIETSVRRLQAKDYTAAQIESALATVYGVDTQLIADGTYFVAESLSAEPLPGESLPKDPRASNVNQPEPVIAGCGGWSKRQTLYGADHCAGREDSLLDPRCDAAKIRAFFVHPDWARRGIASMILEACERAAGSAGFTRLEMGATLTGVPFYRARGYKELERDRGSAPERGHDADCAHGQTRGPISRLRRAPG